jgi:predicted nucleic acid-binding protein
VIVIDAGAVVELLAAREQGSLVAEHVLDAGGRLRAPHLVDFEVASVVRRWVARGEVTESGGRAVLDRLPRLRLRRTPAEPLLERIWQLRHNLTAYDAAYVALAEALDVPLLTTDARLARSTGHTASILFPA